MKHGFNTVTLPLSLIFDMYYREYTFYSLFIETTHAVQVKSSHQPVDGYLITYCPHQVRVFCNTSYTVIPIGLFEIALHSYMKATYEIIALQSMKNDIIY